MKSIIFKHLLQICIFSCLCFASACQRKAKNPNDEFIKKYSRSVEKIKQTRALNEQAQRGVLPSNIDTSLQAQSMMMQQAFVGSKLPDNMFQLLYTMPLSGPFRIRGAEFDSMFIPTKDYYGIPTELEEKDYSLVGNMSLQENLDAINASRTSIDREISRTFIKDLAAVRRRQKLQRIVKESIVDNQVQIEKKDYQTR